MKLKYFLYPLACLIFVLALAACNSDNEYTVDVEQSPEGRIVGFTIDATPFTKMDSITYPALKTRKFTIRNIGGRDIFNNDSLPLYTDIRSLKLNISYAGGAQPKTDLIYPEDKDEKDYPSEWNGTDSVKFFLDETAKMYYPQLKVIAPDGTDRIYTIEFKIHKQDPDSIVWHNMNDLKKGRNFKLPRMGASKVISNSDKTEFVAFINDNNAVYKYTSPMESPIWDNGEQTDLPNTAIVKSLQTTDNHYVIVTSDEQAYTSPITDGKSWTAFGSFKIKSIVGLLPEVAKNRSTPLNEFLVTTRDASEALVYAKTDFEAIELRDVILSTWNNNKVFGDFPLEDFSSISRTINNEDYLMTVGGTVTGADNKKVLIKKPWIISNISIANASEGVEAKVNIYSGRDANILPYASGISAFMYNEKMYAISSDSLRLYTSNAGDSWTPTDVKQKLQHKITDKDGNTSEGMEDMNAPSVVVDNDNYMWVFGGVSSGQNPIYSQKTWVGRINRLGHERQ